MDARKKCLDMGTDLPIIVSADQDSFLVNLIKSASTYTRLGAWIGLKRKADSKFYWIDGTPLEGHYSGWASGEPNNDKGREDCVHHFGKGVDLPKLGKVNDVPSELPGEKPKEAPVILCQKPL